MRIIKVIEINEKLGNFEMHHLSVDFFQLKESICGSRGISKGVPKAPVPPPPSKTFLKINVPFKNFLQRFSGV